MNDEPRAGPSPNGCCGLSRLHGLALLVSIAALAGSLYLSMGLKLKACPLCIYERTFVMGVLAILLMSAGWRELRGSGATAFLALPLAVGGLTVAAFHVWLEARGTLLCPDGVFQIGTAPQQSLTAFILLTLLLSAAGLTAPALGPSLALQASSPLKPEAQAKALRLTAGLALGLLLGVAGLASAPPMPPAKSLSEITEPDICTPIK